MTRYFLRNRISAVAWSIVFVVSSGLVGFGCDRPGGPKRARADSDSITGKTVRSPVDAARALHRAHLARDYLAVEALIVSDRREATVQMLRATDQLIDAHNAMQTAATERFGKHVYRAFHLGELENNLGVFSKDIEILAQHFTGNAATVTVQVAARVPLLRVPFQKVDGRWCYMPPPTSTESLAALRDLTTEVEQLTASLQAGMTPLAYHDAILDRLLPGMAQVANVTTASETGIRVTDAHEADGEP